MHHVSIAGIGEGSYNPDFLLRIKTIRIRIQGRKKIRIRHTVKKLLEQQLIGSLSQNCFLSFSTIPLSLSPELIGRPGLYILYNYIYIYISILYVREAVSIFQRGASLDPSFGGNSRAIEPSRTFVVYYRLLSILLDLVFEAVRIRIRSENAEPDPMLQ